MTEPFFNEIRKRPEFQTELVVALEEELKAMMKEMEAKEAALAAKDVEIESLKLLLLECLNCFEHTPTRPIAVAIKKALEGRG